VEWTRHPLRCHGAGSGRENTLSSLQLERKEEKKHVGAWGEDAGSIREECVRTSYVVMRWAGKEGRTVRVPVLPTCTSSETEPKRMEGFGIQKGGQGGPGYLRTADCQIYLLHVV
jgi:hypothetical protein